MTPSEPKPQRQTLVSRICTEMQAEWLPRIYSEQVRSQRTRLTHIDVPGRENRAEIMFTLLGIELQVGRRRFAAPDLATARYMRVFARLGCGEFAVPYDITHIGPLADELELAWQRSLLLLDKANKASDAPVSRRIRSDLVSAIRREINEIGPGDLMPAFDRATKQKDFEF
ncbi:MAG: hypothetical protein ABI539_15005 [Acidobacteriota bacterium]